MISFFAILLRLFFHAFRSKRISLSENALLKKENDIRAADIKHRLRLVKPETLLYWQRILIKRFWTFEHRPAKRGRKPVDTDVKNLILSMKNDNLL